MKGSKVQIVQRLTAGTVDSDCLGSALSSVANYLCDLGRFLKPSVPLFPPNSLHLPERRELNPCSVHKILRSVVSATFVSAVTIITKSSHKHPLNADLISILTAFTSCRPSSPHLSIQDNCLKTGFSFHPPFELVFHADFLLIFLKCHFPLLSMKNHFLQGRVYLALPDT